MARDGTCNGTLVWVYTTERAKDFLYSDVVITDSEHLFHLKSSPLEWKTVEDLKGITIGATLHTVYPTLEAAKKKGLLRIERSGNYDNLYRRLLGKRIDAIPQVSHVGSFYLQTSLTKEERALISRSDKVVQTRQYHLILSKKVAQNTRFIELFNKGLAIIKENNEYDGVMQALEQGVYYNNRQ